MRALMANGLACRRTFERPAVGVALALLGLTMLVGCRPLVEWRPLADWRQQQPIEVTEAVANEIAQSNVPPEVLDALGRDNWRLKITPPNAPAPLGERWQNTTVDRLAAAAQPPDFHSLLSHASSIVATNAAIVVAQRDDPAGLDQLHAAVAEINLSIPLRRAALDALAGLDAPQVNTLLSQLLAQQTKQPEIAVAELIAELVAALSLRESPLSDAQLLELARHESQRVRLAVVEHWARGARRAVPQPIRDLRGDADASVRAAALKMLVHQHLPDTHLALQQALPDHDLTVRLAAIEALGQMGDDEARRLLKPLLKHDGEVIRAAAVSALARAGDSDALTQLAQDKSWRVRAAVVESLLTRTDPESRQLAEKFLSDNSAEVQRRVVATVAQWPLELSGPVLLAALKGSGYLTRKAAREALMERWPPAAEYALDLPADRRTAAWNDLQRRWTEQFPARSTANRASPSGNETSQGKTTDEMVEWFKQWTASRSNEQRQAIAQKLIPQRGAAVDALEAWLAQQGMPPDETLLTELLPQLENEFAVLDELRSNDVRQRRRAAERLSSLSRDQPLRPLVLYRLAQLVELDSDALVWRAALAAMRTSDDPSADRLACAGTSHVSPEVRQGAVEYLSAHPRRAHVELLLPLIEDPNVKLAQSAVRALGDNPALSDAAPLLPLLSASDKFVRLEAATVLTRRAHEQGPPALERLANDLDPKVARSAVMVIGTLGDPMFVPTLIGLLGRGEGVSHLALEQLPKLTASGPVSNTDRQQLSSDEQIARWRTWWQRQAARGK